MTALLALSGAVLAHHNGPCTNEALIGADSCTFGCHEGQYIHMRLQTLVDANGIGSCGGATVIGHCSIGICDWTSPTQALYSESGSCSGNGVYWGQACWAE